MQVAVFLVRIYVDLPKSGRKVKLHGEQVISSTSMLRIKDG